MTNWNGLVMNLLECVSLSYTDSGSGSRSKSWETLVISFGSGLGQEDEQVLPFFRGVL